MTDPGDAVLPRVLLLRGLELGARLVWSWEWADGAGTPRFAVCSGVSREALLDELDLALPEPIPGQEDEDSDHEQLRADLLRSGDLTDAAHRHLNSRGWVRELTIARRVTDGALAKPDAEVDLMRRLGAELLPPQLVADILSGAGSRPVRLAVMPTPDCAHVPWGLLVAIDDRRLIEVCEVAMLVPSTPHRPSGASGIERSAAQPPLFVIDPDLTGDGVGSVLTGTGKISWVDRIGARASALGVARSSLGEVGRSLINRNWLSDHLHREPRSSLVFLGHANTGAQGGTGASLELNDPERIYSSVPPRPGKNRRSFTALEMLAGTKRAADRRGDPEFGPLGPRFPAVDPLGTRELDGIDVWPMPPKVAIIACRSGLDGSWGEPFGLVTAMQMLGAEQVIATRWRLLTDAVEQYLCGEDPDLAELSLDLEEEVVRAPDMVAAFAGWQRERLRRWRVSPSPATAPFGFAAFAVYVPEWSVASLGRSTSV